MELEDFMRQQFNGEDPAERFPFREEYWEQAKVLLEAAEQERRRRKFLWWWCLGVGVLLVVSAGIYQTFFRTSLPKESQEDTRFSIKGTPDQQSKGLKPITDNRFSATAKDSVQNAHIATNGTKTPDLDFQRIAKPKVTKPPQAHSNHSSAPGPKKSVAKTGQMDLQSFSTASLVEATNKTEELGSKKQGETTTDTAGHYKTALPKSNLEGLPLLNYILLPLTPPMFDGPQSPTIKPSKTERRGLGIVAGAPIYADAPSGRQAGAVVGLYVASAFREYWTLSLGVQWRYRPIATLETILTDRNVRYSFGYTVDEWRQENWAVHYIEVPMSVQRRWGRQNMEAGFVPGMLLGASDRLLRQRSSLYPETTEVLETKYSEGNKSYYRPLYISTFVGGGWAFNRHMELYGRIFYRPNSLRKNIGEASGLKGKIWPELGLRLSLK